MTESKFVNEEPLKSQETGLEKFNKIEPVKAIEQIKEGTSIEEFESYVLEYLKQRFGIDSKENPAFGIVRDAVLCSSVFAPSPATFDLKALNSTFEIYIPSAKNVQLLAFVLEDFGAIQFVEEIDNSWQTAKFWADIELEKQGYEGKELVPMYLYEHLIEEQQILTKDRYEIKPDIQKRVMSVFEQY